MKFVAIIPARFSSTRFPGKPLALLAGKPIIQHVYERVAGVLENVFVATDDERIETCVKGFGGRVVMTSEAHKSGTDRCYEAYQKCGVSADVIINVQGDEPFIALSQLEEIQRCFDTPSVDIATLVKPFDKHADFAALDNPNTPKVVMNERMEALYFSRSIIPYLRGVEREEWLQHHDYYKHLGLYAYRADVLAKIVRLPQGQLELAESLEQLRWLEAGLTIKVGVTQEETIGIDTPEDLERARQFMEK